MDSILGIGLGVWILLGVVVLILGVAGNKLGLSLSKKGANIMVVIGLVATILGVGVYFGVDQLIVSEEPPIVEEATFAVSPTVAAAEHWATYDANARSFTIAMDFNDTANTIDNNTECMQVNFTVSRTDFIDKNAGAAANMGTVALVDVAGATDEYILDENADHTKKFKWTTADGIAFWEDAVVGVDAFGSTYVLLNVTVNAAAVAAMSEYQTAQSTFTLAGYTFSIICLKANAYS